MDEKMLEEVVYMLDELSHDTSVAKNVRNTATDSKSALSKEQDSLDLRCPTVVSLLDEIANDPNLPAHGRASLYTIISRLEALAKT